MTPREPAAGGAGKVVFTVLGPGLAYALSGLLAAAGIWYEFGQIDRNLDAVARERGAVLFRLIELTRDWNAEHGGVYVPVTDKTRPNPYLEDPKRDVVTVDGLRLTKINPAFMTRQISEIAARAQGLQFHITSLKPIRPANAPDPWERESLELFERGVTERISLVAADAAAPIHRYMAPLLVKQACMKCHEGQGYRVGDIRGGISVSTPAADLLDVRDAQRLRAKWVAVAFFAALAGLTHLLILRARRYYDTLWTLNARQEALIGERTAELSEANEQLRRDAEERERHQRRIAESEARYRAAVESSREGIYLTDGRLILFANQRLAAMFGIPSEDLIGMATLELVHGDDLDRAAGTLARYLGGEQESARLRCRIRHADPQARRYADMEIARVPADDESGARYLVTVADVTEKLATEQELGIAAAVFESAAEGIVVTDADNRILRVNPAFSAITGYTPREVVGRDPGMLKSGRHGPEFYADMWRKIGQEGRWEGEITNRAKDGRIYVEWLAITTIAGAGATDGAGRYVATFSDITRRKEAEDAVRYQAQHDPLTGLPNRSLFADRLLSSLAAAHRHGWGCALMYLDLDRFKEVNDRLGHAAGDALLVETARRLLACVRENDTVARFGGDEFAIILGEVTSPADAERIARRAIAALAAPFDLSEGPASVSASIGIARYPEHGTDPDRLRRNADAALYAAKKGGRNTFRFHEPRDDTEPPPG
ncbi:MAG: diguanylate cyclase [Rhodocyclaceae bacterium]|nr:diguanylate cyclase [Rhodocyclaceae bacterium]